jgi:peptide/nickel transport system substrate-binding protein
MNPGYYYFGVNALDPLFADVRVRQALHYLIDAASISAKITRQFGPEPRQLPVQKDDIGALADDPWSYDLAKAKELLKQAGHPDGFSATLLVLPDAPFSDMATAIQASMAAAGIKIDIRTGGGNIVYGAARERKYQMIVGRGGNGPIPEIAEGSLRELMWNPDNSATSKIRRLVWRSGYSNAEANQLLDKLRTPLTETDQVAAVKRLQQIFIDDAWPYMPVVHRADPVAARKDVHNLVPSVEWIPRWDLVEKH